MQVHFINALAAASIIATQALDWHSTLAFLKQPHTREGNGVLAKLFERHGANRVMAAKFILHLPLAALFLVLPPIAVLGLLPYLFICYRTIRKNYWLARGGHL